MSGENKQSEGGQSAKRHVLSSESSERIFGKHRGFRNLRAYQLGEVLRDVLRNSSAHIIAMTGSYFQADSQHPFCKSVVGRFQGSLDLPAAAFDNRVITF